MVWLLLARVPGDPAEPLTLALMPNPPCQVQQMGAIGLEQTTIAYADGVPTQLRTLETAGDPSGSPPHVYDLTWEQGRLTRIDHWQDASDGRIPQDTTHLKWAGERLQSVTNVAAHDGRTTVREVSWEGGRPTRVVDRFGERVDSVVAFTWSADRPVSAHGMDAEGGTLYQLRYTFEEQRLVGVTTEQWGRSRIRSWNWEGDRLSGLTAEDATFGVQLTPCASPTGPANTTSPS